MSRCASFVCAAVVLTAVGLASSVTAQSPESSAIPELMPTDTVNPGLQFEGNPPMQFRTRMPPPLPEPTEDFEVREGFTLIETLDEFRAAIKRDNQKIRMKPGTTADSKRQLRVVDGR